MAAALASRMTAQNSPLAGIGALDPVPPTAARRTPCHCVLELPCHFELAEVALALRSAAAWAVVVQAAFAVRMAASSGSLVVACTSALVGSRWSQAASNSTAAVAGIEGRTATVRTWLEAGKIERGWLALVCLTTACRSVADLGKRTVVVASSTAAAEHRPAAPYAQAIGSGRVAARSMVLVAAERVTQCQER